MAPVVAAGLIGAGGGLLSTIFGSREAKKRQNAELAAAQAAGRNQYGRDKALYSGAVSGNERQRTLDPARNAVLSAIMGKQFAGRVDPNTVNALREAGPRPALDPYPEYQDGAAAYAANAPSTLDMILSGLGDSVGAPIFNALALNEQSKTSGQPSAILERILSSLGGNTADQRNNALGVGFGFGADPLTLK